MTAQPLFDHTPTEAVASLVEAAREAPLDFVGTVETGPESGSFAERLLGAWYKQRGLKGYVTRGQIDPDKLGALWQSCFVIKPEDRRGPLVFSRIGRLPSFPEDKIDSSKVAPMLLDWIGDLACLSFNEGTPLIRKEFFPSQVNGHEFACVVLPLTDGLGVVRSVLGLIEAAHAVTGE